MGDMDRLPFLNPAYEFGAINQSTLLSKETVVIQVGRDSYSGQAEVRLDLLPRASVHIYGILQEIPIRVALEIATGQKEISYLTFGGKEVACLLVSAKPDLAKKEAVFKWCLKSEPLVGRGDDHTSICRLVFHIFNFEEIIGMRRTSEQGGSTIEHADFLSDVWRLELESLMNTRENFKKLKDEGGYCLTHLACLEKTDGSCFSGKEAEEILGAMRFFLSFAKGGWCNPICAVGLDSSDNWVWESWSSPKEPWFSPLSWFDPHHSDQLAMLFPGFIAKWLNEGWREALREIFYWYLNSNNSSRGIDAGIILTQAALERLSFEYAVKDRLLIETAGFKDLRASDKLRLLLSSLNIPIGITGSTPELAKLAKERNWLDAPQAMTEVRNALVHPEHKNRGYVTSILHDTWNLGLWYLELALLRLCGYSGTYCNRLSARWVGQVEDVPWVKKTKD
jgi:hypothetical protein